jgi:hypothetical protein
MAACVGESQGAEGAGREGEREGGREGRGVPMAKAETASDHSAVVCPGNTTASGAFICEEGGREEREGGREGRRGKRREGGRGEKGRGGEGGQAQTG